MSQTAWGGINKIDSGLRQPEVPINDALEILASLCAGKLDITTTGGTTTLTGTPTAPQAQNEFLNVSGTLTSNAIVEIPVAAGTGRNRIYAVKNGTTGAFSLTVRAVGQTGVVVGQGSTALLLFNGTDIQSVVSSFIGARVFHSANQSISNAASTTLAFNSERYDVGLIHDTSTNNERLTCRVAGKYEVKAHVSFAGNATGARITQLRLNGTTAIASQSCPAASATLGTDHVLSTDYDLAVGDYVEVRVYQDSGGSLNVLTSGNYSPEFSMKRIG